jgi:hypothetical protein
VFDQVPVESVSRAEGQVREAVLSGLPEICRRIEDGEKLTDDDRRDIIETAMIALE